MYVTLCDQGSMCLCVWCLAPCVTVRVSLSAVWMFVSSVAVCLTCDVSLVLVLVASHRSVINVYLSVK